MVANDQHDETWGAIVGYNVRQQALPPNDPERVGLTGSLTLVVSGFLPPGAAFARVTVAGQPYCNEITTGSTTFRMSALRKNCRVPGGAPYAGEPIDSIQIWIATKSVLAPLSAT